jgi:hypothetical protein
MIVAGVVIETVEGAAPRVAARLLREPALELEGGDGHRRLAAVFIGENAAGLEALAKRLLEDDPEVLGVFPTYVADATAEPQADGGARADGTPRTA